MKRFIEESTLLNRLSDILYVSKEMSRGDKLLENRLQKIGPKEVIQLLEEEKTQVPNFQQRLSMSSTYMIGYTRLLTDVFSDELFDQLEDNVQFKANFCVFLDVLRTRDSDQYSQFLRSKSFYGVLKSYKKMFNRF